MPLALPSPNFNPQAPRGARPTLRHLSRHRFRFQSTGPSRGPTLIRNNQIMTDHRFQSTGPSRGPTTGHTQGRRGSTFQSTGPSRGPTSSFLPEVLMCAFQSTGPSRGPTHFSVPHHPDQEISIHRPLAGPDRGLQQGVSAGHQFQSTGPSRGPTVSEGLAIYNTLFQSTGPSRGPTA